jgi:hypothetical protein
VSVKDNKALWLIIVGMAAVIAVLIWLLIGNEPYRLVILFDDIGGLKKEDPVVWKGFDIGKVEDIRPLVDNKIGVTIRVKEDYVTGLTHGTEFTLKRGPLLGLLGRDAVEVFTPASPGSPFSRGEKVRGRAAPQPSIISEGKELGAQYWNQLKDETSRLLQDFRNSPYQKDVDEALAKLKALSEEGLLQAKDGLAKFGRDHQKDLEDAVANLKSLRDKLLKLGDRAGAQRVEKQIEKVEEGIKP